MHLTLQRIMISAQITRHLGSLVPLVLLIACNPQTVPVTPSNSVASLDLFQPEGELIEETWESHLVRDAKVGHRLTQKFRLDQLQPPRIKTIAIDRLELRRFSDVNHVELTTVSVETEAGKLERLGYQQLSSGSSQPTTAELTVGDDNTATLTRGNDPSQTKRIRWGPDQEGIFAIKHSLETLPMKPGETRRVEAFLPLSDSTATYELSAVGVEETKVGSRTDSLLRIDVADMHPDSWKIPSAYWCDDAGKVLKTQEAFLSRETIVVDEQQANASNDAYRMDFGIDTGVALDEPITRPDLLNTATFRVKLKGLDPLKVFPSGLSQRVVAGEAGEAMITVKRIVPNGELDPNIEIDPPKPADLEPNDLITSDHPRIVNMAKIVRNLPPSKAARRIEQFLHRRITEKNYAQVFKSAAEVVDQAEPWQGDCSEHSVLLAAVCRAKNIPARIVVGLIYSPAEQSFLYHMWNEVWIDDRWLPLDATRGQGGIGATYIKLRHSSLARQSPYSIVSPVVYLMDRLQIEHAP